MKNKNFTIEEVVQGLEMLGGGITDSFLGRRSELSPLTVKAIREGESNVRQCSLDKLGSYVFSLDGIKELLRNRRSELSEIAEQAGLTLASVERVANGKSVGSRVKDALRKWMFKNVGVKQAELAIAESVIIKIFKDLRVRIERAERRILYLEEKAGLRKNEPF